MANESFSVTLDVQQGDLYPTSKVRVNILVHYLDERNLRRNSSRDCFVRTNHTRYSSQFPICIFALAASKANER